MSKREYIKSCSLKKLCGLFLKLPQAYLQPCETGAEKRLSIWKRGAGELEWETFPSEGKPDCKTLLKISDSESCGACWTGVLFQPRKMTGIHCANHVQMSGWVSHITHILSCLHAGFHLQTISNFQIALSFFFSCRSGSNCGQIPMLPGCWREPLSGKVFFLPCCAPTERMEEEGERVRAQSCRLTPSLCGGCPSLLPQCWIPICAHRAGQWASRTVTTACPHLNSTLWHVHLFSHACVAACAAQ